MFMGTFVGPEGILAAIAVEFITLSFVYAMYSILDFQSVCLSFCFAMQTMYSLVGKQSLHACKTNWL